MNRYTGEFDSDNQMSRVNQQQEFLEAVREHAPEVLEDLGNEPLTHFIDAGLNEGHPAVNCVDWDHLQSIDSDSPPDEAIVRNLRPLHKSLWRWSGMQGHGLDADWCRATAFFTLSKWSRSDTNERKWNFPRTQLVVLENNFSANELTFRTVWLPAYIGKTEFKKHAENLFKTELKNYLNGIDALSKKQGLHRQKGKNEPLHFYWLVLYQVKKWEYRDIFTHCFPNLPVSDTKRVRKAVNELGKFINLPLRPEPRHPGRRTAR